MKSLHNLIDKATLAAVQQDRQIKLLISRIVPVDVVEHIQYCRLEAGRLRMTVDNANWIARLRFSERQIVGALRESGLDVVTLSCHVAPMAKPVVREPVRVHRAESPVAASAVETLARNLAAADEKRTNACSNHFRGSAIDDRSAGAGDDESRATASHLHADSQHASTERLRRELLRLAARLRGER